MALTALFAELARTLEATGVLAQAEISALMDVARLRLLRLGSEKSENQELYVRANLAIADMMRQGGYESPTLPPGSV